MTAIARLVRTWGSWALLSLLAAAALAEDFTVGNYEVVSSRRIGRTEFEYVLRATVTNNLLAAQGVSARVTSMASNTVVLQNTLLFGDVLAPASAVSTNTFTIRQDRLFPFDPSMLRWTVTVQSMQLGLAISAPGSGLLTNGTNVLVTGSVGAGVSNVVVNGVVAALAGTNFMADVSLREGRNTISAVGTNQYGGVGVASVTVNRDTTPPIVNIENPTAGAILTTRQITITGMINDVVPGTVNPEQAQVMVNGLPAMILNRSYAITDVLLTPGKNIINVVARDRAGNDTQRSIEVTVMDAALQKRLNRLAGDAQSGMIGTTLPQPLVVELVDANGVVQTNQPVTFNICRNDGMLLAPPDQQGRTITRLTDTRGQAQIFFQLGTRTGAGNNQVDVTSPGVLGQVIFCANATGSPPNRISALLPETQVGETSKPLPQPWTAYVTDIGGNPVAGVPVTFLVFQGDGGTVNGATMVITNTDTDGRASVVHTLGPQEGINNHVVAAMITGLTNSAATFTASGRTPAAVQNTRVVGLVLDNANRPMSNILCRIDGTASETVTDAQGQFTLSNAPVGTVHLFVDARDRGYPGTWHALEFVVDTVAGRDNSVDRPIYMLPLSDSALAGGAQPVTLQMRDMPGASMTIFPGSVRDANGRPVVTNVSFTQVNMERVPMPPPLGSQFMLAWTVQPAGLHFDPPAQMCIPNMGAPAGQVVEMFSFDHDLIQFVAIGTATVTTDGALMCSDPGFGVTKSGWGGCVPPPPCKKCVGTTPPPCNKCDPCQGVLPDPSQNGNACDDKDPCTANDRCQNGACKGDKIEITKAEVKVDGEMEAARCTNDMFAFTVDVTQMHCPTLEYKWDFGDGMMSTSQSPMHSYDMPREYTVKVTVSCKECPSAKKEGSAKVWAVGVGFTATRMCYGFDDTLTPPWLMVPKGEIRSVVTANISPGSAADKVKFMSSAAGTATVSPATAASASQDLAISGVAKGDADIEVKVGMSMKVCATLKVAVKDKVTKTVAIHAITEENDDVQAIPVGQGQPNQTCITAGPNGTINTAAAGDDTVSGTSITTGPNGLCETAAAGDDVQAIPSGRGRANVKCVTKGLNAFRDTGMRAGDDALDGADEITTGPDGICNTAANNMNLVPTAVPTAAGLQTYLNDIWGRQANVHFTVTRADHRVNYDLDRNGMLADPVLVSMTAVENNAISAVASDATVDYNIYYVNSHEVPIGLTIGAEVFTQGAGANSIVNHTAHEVGHLLGIGYESNNVDDVMYRAGLASNPCRVIKRDWDTINP